MRASEGAPSKPLPDAPGPPGCDRLVLVGMMGAGKSTVARALADRLGWPLLDTDRAVEQRRGRTVAEIFAAEGEGSFRAEEARAIADMVRLKGPIVVSVGGGAVTEAVNRQVLCSGACTVVWLRASADTLASRVGTGQGRPLLAAAAGGAHGELQRLAEERRPLYEEVATLVVDVDGLGSREVARQVLAALGASEEG